MREIVKRETIETSNLLSFGSAVGAGWLFLREFYLWKPSGGSFEEHFGCVVQEVR